MKKEITEKKKEKDYRKLSGIKSAVFLVLAVLVLAGMFLEKKPENSGTVPAAAAIELPESTVSVQNQSTDSGKQTEDETLTVSEHEKYSDKEHVALYLHQYQKLPENYITKTQAKKKGWVQESGNLWEVCPGMSIGGGPFQNEEGRLPEKEGRSWKECDIDYQGGNRNGKRLVWSDDGLIYYTEDHYETFECIYGEEK